MSNSGFEPMTIRVRTSLMNILLKIVNHSFNESKPEKNSDSRSFSTIVKKLKKIWN